MGLGPVLSRVLGDPSACHQNAAKAELECKFVYFCIFERYVHFKHAFTSILTLHTRNQHSGSVGFCVDRRDPKNGRNFLAVFFVTNVPFLLCKAALRRLHCVAEQKQPAESEGSRRKRATVNATRFKMQFTYQTENQFHPA